MPKDLSWFPFDPADWLTDMHVLRMTLAQRGAYITLLCFEWLEGWLPSDSESLARLVGVGADDWDGIWREPLSDRFKEKSGRLFNPRLEAERKKAKRLHDDRVRWGREGAKRRYGNQIDDSGSHRVPIAKLKGGHSSVTKAKRRRSHTQEQEQLQEQRSRIAFEQNTGESRKAGKAPGKPDAPSSSWSKPIWWDTERGKLDGTPDAKRELASRFVGAKLLTMDEFKTAIEAATYWLADRPHRRRSNSNLKRFLINWLDSTLKDKRSGETAKRRIESKSNTTGRKQPEPFRPQWCGECRETLPAHADWCKSGKEKPNARA